MMVRKQSGMITLYAIGGLLAACVVMGVLLKSSYTSNGKLQSDVNEALSALEAKQLAFEDLTRQKNREEVIIVDNLAEKEIVEVKVEKVIYKIQEVIKNAPPESCLVQPIDSVILDCLRDLSCDEAGDTEGLSPGLPDGRLSGA